MMINLKNIMLRKTRQTLIVKHPIYMKYPELANPPLGGRLITRLG